MSIDTVTYASTIKRHHSDYQHQLDLHRISPFVLPADICSYVLIICFLAIATQRSLASRLLVLLAIIIRSVLTLQYSRSVGLSAGVIIGIASCWAVLATIQLLFIQDLDNTFRQCPLVEDRTTNQKLLDSRRRDEYTRDAVHWQRMPTATFRRLFWIVDLLGSLRLVHWSVQDSRNRSGVPRIGRCNYGRGDLSMHRCVARLCLIYLAIDVLKEMVAQDPYFWGYIDADFPEHIRSFLHFTVLFQAYRMIVAFALIYLAIALITSAGHLVFVNILGPKFAGTWGYEWAYRPQHGSLAAIYTDGLRAFWGSWWHQMFRYMLTSIANKVVDLLRLDHHTALANHVRLFISFTLSGVIHACGSYTLWGKTKPLNAFLFFLLQPLGIDLQILYGQLIKKFCNHKPPLVLLGLGNVIFTAVWLLNTFPLLADDFARGGLWLAEPFPISIIQLLRIGSEQRPWFIWLDPGIRWHIGHRWWQSGIAF